MEEDLEIEKNTREAIAYGKKLYEKGLIDGTYDKIYEKWFGKG